MFDIRQRYRRSVLGPLWITISTGITVIALGFLWSTIFKADIKVYMPYFATGLVLWNFFSAQINDSCTTYIQYEAYIKQINIPLPIYVLRVLAKNIIVLAHNFLIVIFVWVYFGFEWQPNIALTLVGFCMFIFSLFFVSIVLATICTRFRDITPIVQSALQVLYFFTPVIWQESVISAKYHWVVEDNPLFHMFQLVRGPVLGQVVETNSYYIVLGIFIICVILGCVTHAKYRYEVSYWF